jgi:hypothetical protein
MVQPSAVSGVYSSERKAQCCLTVNCPLIVQYFNPLTVEEPQELKESARVGRVTGSAR